MSRFSDIVPPSLLLSISARQKIQFAARFSAVSIVGIAYLIYWTSDLDEGYVIPHSDILITALMSAALAFAVLWIAMGAFLRKFDRSSDGKRALWWLLIISTGPIGALVYCYAVYLPQTKTLASSEKAMSTSSAG